MVMLSAAIDFQDLLQPDNLIPLLRIGALLFVVLPLILFLNRILRRVLRGRVSAQHSMLICKAVTYLAVTIVLLMTLRELGFKLTTVLGAAGIMGVAVGFAAQTSLSNLISGIFMMAENTFEIGDIIKVGNTVGRVKSIDLLSIKLRTMDNQLIRIPNETLVKTELANVTAFGIRRLDIPIGVAYGSDLPRVMQLLKAIAAENPQIMDEPKPLISITGFGDSSVNLIFGVWMARDNWLTGRDSCLLAVHDRFREAGIEIPFPQRTVHWAGAPPMDLSTGDSAET